MRTRLFQAVVGVALLGGASPALGSIIDNSGATVQGDFNGDGVLEKVVSSPEANCSKGKIYVLSTTTGTVTTWTRDSAGILGVAACNDLFGASLVAADINGNGYDDLVIAVPGAADSGVAGSGSIHIIYGSATGLTDVGDQIWHQNTTGIADVAETNDHFGDALTAGDFNCDTYADIAIGVPREGIGSLLEAGAVNVIYGSSTGLSTTNDEWYQGFGGVNDTAETNDHFGAALAAANFNGDTYNGHACDDLTIAAPHEDIGTIVDAGFVYFIRGSSARLSSTRDQSLYQDLSGIVDACETNDRFGWRLEVAKLDADVYPDLRVIVPGDGCTGATGWGRHSFHGSSGGIATTGNAVDCDLFGCRVEGDNIYCTGNHEPLYGSANANIEMTLFEDDLAWGGDGNDTMRAAVGHDVLFGGVGNDILDGSAGRDVLIGGAGNDTFTIDLDCEASPGDVVDGGPGTDTVQSHKTQSQLVAMGVTFSEIEQFVTVPQDPWPGGPSCAEFPFFDGEVVQPNIGLSWVEVPGPDDILHTTTGVLHVVLTNSGSSSFQVTVVARLVARGYVATQTLPTATVAPGTPVTLTLDINDFIPAGIDPSTIPPELLDPSSSASMTTVARVKTTAGTVVETAIAPRLYGHVEGGDTAVIYGSGALASSYNHGDLENLGRSSRTGSRGTTEAYGSLGVLP